MKWNEEQNGVEWSGGERRVSEGRRGEERSAVKWNEQQSGVEWRGEEGEGSGVK